VSDRLTEARTALETHRDASDAGEASPSLFDAVQERDAAIASTTETWRGQVLDELDQHLDRLARERETFTVDDLRDVLPAHLTDGVDQRVLGSTFTRAVRRKVIKPIGFTASRRRHAAPIRVWQSAVCDAA
jgi:hypothetical protein